MNAPGLRVIRGGATPEELAALLAVLAQRPVPRRSAYEQWRATRQAAVRPRR